VRVQCKWASHYDGVIVVRCNRNRRNRDGLLRQYYSPHDIDAYAAYCRENRRCYFLPIDEFQHRIAIQLRLAATKNKQELRINWAKDYEFAARLGSRGAVAQLGERLAGSQ
jgi:PD-(D/E)XK endonuclease